MEDINKIVEMAAQRAYEIYMYQEQQKTKRKKKEIAKNTKKLLKEYKRLKLHVEHAVSTSIDNTPTDIQLVISEIFDKNGYIKVQAIMESKERSELIVSHIEKMLKLYKKECEERHIDNYNVLEAYYIDHVTVVGIAEKMHVDESTVWRALRAAIEDMGILLFGVMAIDTHN